MSSPTSHQDQFSNSSKFYEKIWGGELRDSWQDFEIGVATRLDNNIRVSHPKSPNF